MQDRFREDRNRAQTCGDIDSKMEPEYDVVDDHEEVHNVRIFPARPINDEREYAGKNRDAHLAPIISLSLKSLQNTSVCLGYSPFFVTMS